MVQRDVIEGRCRGRAPMTIMASCLRPVPISMMLQIDEPRPMHAERHWRAQRHGAPPMIDRGEGYEKMLRGEHAAANALNFEIG